MRREHQPGKMWLRSVVLFAVLGVIVRCELDRRDVHRIILKPERSKKPYKKHHKHHHASKNHYKPHHYHHDIDYEPQAHASSYHSDETPYYYESPVHKPHHRYQNHHEEYHELTKPRPPKKDDRYAYPQEDKIKYPSKHFRKENKDIWTPMSSQNKPVSRKPPKTVDFTPSKKHQRRKTTPNPPTLSDMIDLTTSIPRKFPLPVITANQFQYSVPHDKKQRHITPESLIPKDVNISEHSYEVHEDYFEPKTVKPTTKFGSNSPHMESYLHSLKAPQHFLPTNVPYLAGNSFRNSDEYGVRTRPPNMLQHY